MHFMFPFLILFLFCLHLCPSSLSDLGSKHKQGNNYAQCFLLMFLYCSSIFSAIHWQSTNESIKCHWVEGIVLVSRKIQGSTQVLGYISRDL